MYYTIEKKGKGKGKERIDEFSWIWALPLWHLKLTNEGTSSPNCSVSHTFVIYLFYNLPVIIKIFYL